MLYTFEILRKLPTSLIVIPALISAVSLALSKSLIVGAIFSTSNPLIYDFPGDAFNASKELEVVLPSSVFVFP